MSKTDNEVKLYMKHRAKYTQEAAGAKVGMTAKTGRKYEKSGLLPSQSKQLRSYKTRVNPFAEHVESIKNMFIKSPGLHVKTILTHLMEAYPSSNYSFAQQRTLDRIIKPLRLLHGKNKEIYFPQIIRAGYQSQSDWTNMNELNIIIDNTVFKHLIFHFMLPYSCWESISICYSETFDSLANGYQKAVHELGGIAHNHKTDNSSTATKATKSNRAYTSRYSDLMHHYGVNMQRNNPGCGNENGSVEKSHDLFKIAVEQALLIRGNREFVSIETYCDFLENLVKLRNLERQVKVAEEKQLLNALPPTKYEYNETSSVSVNKFGMIHINGQSYSVSTKLVSSRLEAVVGCNNIKLYNGIDLVESIPKSTNKINVNYRHIIDSLIKKPGAFANYQYQHCLYPQFVYKQSYEILSESNVSYAKHYLKLLYLAKQYGEDIVATKLKKSILSGTLIDDVTTDKFERQLATTINESNLDKMNNMSYCPNLAAYNHAFLGGATWN